MPKKKKQPRRPTRRPSLPSTGSVPDGFSGMSMGASRGLLGHTVPDTAWDELRTAFLERQPQCPDCGSPWDMETASEEEGVTFGGQMVISIAVSCSAYDEDEDEGREPQPHPISGGMGEHELTIA